MIAAFRKLRIYFTASRDLMRHARETIASAQKFNAHRHQIKHFVRYRAATVSRGGCVRQQKMLLDFDLRQLRASAKVARDRMVNGVAI